MTQVKAIFDGEKVVLPAGFKAPGPSEVTVTFPDADVMLPPVGKPIWEILRDGYRSDRSVDDVTRQVRALRDEWDEDPRDRLREKP